MTAKKKTTTTTKKAAKPKAPAELGEVLGHEAGIEAGFTGVGIDPLPNEAYSLETGPKSPTHVEQQESVK